jgi:YgiT-type zinc finger domain-containing protein
MQCIVCRHMHTQPGFATVTLHRDGCVVVFKETPAEICSNCGEYCLNDEMNILLLQQAEIAITSGAEVEIRRYTA